MQKSLSLFLLLCLTIIGTPNPVRSQVIVKRIVSLINKLDSVLSGKFVFDVTQKYVSDEKVYNSRWVLEFETDSSDWETFNFILAKNKSSLALYDKKTLYEVFPSSGKIYTSHDPWSKVRRGTGISTVSRFFSSGFLNVVIQDSLAKVTILGNTDTEKVVLIQSDFSSTYHGVVNTDRVELRYVPQTNYIKSYREVVYGMGDSQVTEVTLVQRDTLSTQKRLIDRINDTINSLSKMYSIEEYHPTNVTNRDTNINELLNMPIPISTSKTFKISDLPDKIVLVDFWYSTCAPCLLSLPVLEKIYKEYKDSGVTIIGLNTVDKDTALMNKTIRRFGMQYPNYSIVFPDSGSFAINNFPTLFVIKNGNTVVDKIIGYSESLEERLRTVIRNTLHPQTITDH